MRSMTLLRMTRALAGPNTIMARRSAGGETAGDGLVGNGRTTGERAGPET